MAKRGTFIRGNVHPSFASMVLTVLSVSEPWFTIGQMRKSGEVLGGLMRRYKLVRDKCVLFAEHLACKVTHDRFGRDV